ncbi:MAG: F0F1 ATP synthase subunit alpha [Candidatus Saganbacteria bacterium]|nr:F0F1 ATP synthase subunit alpha [Candidatus Saganbacteria bacterium]
MKEITPEQIASIIKTKIDEFAPGVKTREIGTVLESGDGIAHISGLPNAMASEMVQFSSGTYGLVFNLEIDEITAIVLGAHTSVKEGDTAKLTGHLMSVPVGPELIGRIINSVGEPMDEKGPLNARKFRPIESPAPAVIDRQPVNVPLQTGYKSIDALVPIGRGQRELIIGDRSTGKSSIAIDSIINQKGKDVICIYVAIGQKDANVVQLAEKLEEAGAMDYTIIVNASASDAGSLQYLAPFSGCAIAEEFMYAHNKDVLILYDDLTKHADAYRMLSLLLRRPPGREAYPGDVFYLHARLLERAAKLNDTLGGGSITALPIIETQVGDISAYIPTNVISITDGQIFLSTDLFNSGIRPAINVGTSVSRVGGQAQIKAMRRIVGNLRINLAQYREKESFSIVASELDKETKLQITRGKILVEVLKQKNYLPLPVENQVAILYAGTKGFLDTLPVDKVQSFETKLFTEIEHNAPEIFEKIRKDKDFDGLWEETLGKLILKVKEQFVTE